jgi:hypothetical protein
LADEVPTGEPSRKERAYNYLGLLLEEDQMVKDMEELQKKIEALEKEDPTLLHVRGAMYKGEHRPQSKPPGPKKKPLSAEQKKKLLCRRKMKAIEKRLERKCASGEGITMQELKDLEKFKLSSGYTKSCDVARKVLDSGLISDPMGTREHNLIERLLVETPKPPQEKKKK